MRRRCGRTCEQAISINDSVATRTHTMRGRLPGRWYGKELNGTGGGRSTPLGGGRRCNGTRPTRDFVVALVILQRVTAYDSGIEVAVVPTGTRHRLGLQVSEDRDLRRCESRAGGDLRFASDQTNIWPLTTVPHLRPLTMNIGCVRSEVVFSARLGSRLGYIDAALVRTRLAKDMRL